MSDDDLTVDIPIDELRETQRHIEELIGPIEIRTSQPGDHSCP